MNPEARRSARPPVLLLGSQIATGGAQRLLLSLGKWLHEQGYPVTAAFLYDKEGLRDSWQAQLPFPLIDLQAWDRRPRRLPLLFSMPRAVFRLWRLLGRGRFSAVVSYTHHASLFGQPLAWLARVPARVAVHPGRILGFPLWAERLHGRLANLGIIQRIVAVSDQVETETRAEGARPERIALIPNGVEFIPPQPESRARVRRALGLAEDACLALNVARITTQKGQDVLVRAAPAALQACPQLVIALAGDGPERAACEALAAGLGVDNAVRFLGTRTDVPDLLAAADLFVLPSRSEGMPLALIEAMGAGLAVVASAAGGVAELLADGQRGLVVPCDDPAALADGLARLCANPDLRRRLAESGQQHARSEYSSEVMSRRYADLIHSLWEQSA